MVAVAVLANLCESRLQTPVVRGRSMTLHVIDTDEASLGATGWLEDVSKVEKYVMSEEDYMARDNTYRK